MARRSPFDALRARFSRSPASGSTHHVSAEYVAAIGGAAAGRVRTLGTFGGVFTPSFLTIIGVIMYLRFSWVVGNAGLLQAIIIVVIANSITYITSLSVASIASNERMDTGGAYFMVSRVLGAQAGGGIGIPLYVSQALSIALYVMGFAEAISAIVPAWSPVAVALVTMVALALLGVIGAGFMVKIQYAILAVILVSFVSIAAGFQINGLVLTPDYRDGTSFWGVFAVFFPAVTGILAGVSMSGDLKDPARAIPRGTIAAVTAGFVVYLLVPVMLAFTVGREELFASTALRDASRWPLLVTFGVIGATLSSAIGSLLGAPRTLQALAKDSIAPRLFAAGVGPTEEPLLATILSMALATGAILLGSLNAVASVLTMFFLTTYGVLNISAALEVIVGNPSFRPTLRIPAWLSMAGGVACFGVMVLIDPVASAVAVVLVGAIFVALRGRTQGGGLWEGFWTSRLFAVARRLEASRASSSGKNWRPLVQLFAGEEATHRELVATGLALTRHGGALATYTLVRPERGRASSLSEHASRVLADMLANPALTTSAGPTEVATSANAPLPGQTHFTSVIEVDDFAAGVLISTQAATFAGSTYNTVMLGMPTDAKRDQEFARMLLRLSRYRRDVVIMRRRETSWLDSAGPIIVWWGGQENNVRLMVVLADILRRETGQEREIVVATVVREKAHAAAAEARLVETVADLRIRATSRIVVAAPDAGIAAVLAEESQAAALAMIGMAQPSPDGLRGYMTALRATTDGLPTTLLVQCNLPDIRYE